MDDEQAAPTPIVTTPIVTIPRGTRRNDTRWSIAKMIAHLDRGVRVENAERVLHSRSRHVEARHRELARSIIDGPGDLIGAKLSHSWTTLSPAEPMYFCEACDLLLSAWQGQWCPGRPEEDA